tara:strand:- start:324 stop:1172 length:849 start_codon:yes stop_codon:yes gene_type:complete
MEFQAIWDTFSKIQKKDLPIAPKGTLKLDYLSWAKALHMAIDHFPDLTFDCNKEQIYEDGTMMVFASVTIGGHTREMWLPVMDHKNNSIVSPSSRQISDNKMRCLVKCFALFGLGLNVYAGEDLKYLEEGEEPKNKPAKKEDKTWQEEVAESSDVEIVDPDVDPSAIYETEMQIYNQFIIEKKNINELLTYWVELLSIKRKEGVYGFPDMKENAKDIYAVIVEHRDHQVKSLLDQVEDIKTLENLIVKECKKPLKALRDNFPEDFKEIMAIATERKKELGGK